VESEISAHCADLAAALAGSLPFFAYPLEVRKIIYTTNAIESLNMQVRKVIKNRVHFQNDEAALKLIYLALRNITKKMEDAAYHLACCQNPIRHSVRRTLHGFSLRMA
jgi:putative transposase